VPVDLFLHVGLKWLGIFHGFTEFNHLPMELLALVFFRFIDNFTVTPDAQFTLGMRYDTGEGRAQNDEEAVKWLRYAAEQGHAEAQFALGTSILYGKGVSKDEQEAVKWYRKAAEQGHVIALLSLGKIYYMGEIVVLDYIKACMWYNLAAESGDIYSQDKYESIKDEMTSDEITEAQRLSREWKSNK
jgi:TPR repeat protein